MRIMRRTLLSIGVPAGARTQKSTASEAVMLSNYTTSTFMTILPQHQS